MKMESLNTPEMKQALGSIDGSKRAVSIPEYDARNRQGFDSYSLSDELRLLGMLNTLKIEPQFYRSESETMVELRDLIESVASKDPLFVAQMIVWSRCCGEGMRSINHLAAVLLAPYISGLAWAKGFYGAFDKKSGYKGGCVYRLDDMLEMKNAYKALSGRPVSNAMKKGFASVLEQADTYQLCKYKKAVIDIANLSHPNPEKSTAKAVVNSAEVNVLNALMCGINIPSETWETGNVKAGQEVAEAVKSGKLSEEKAAEVLVEAKNDNFEQLIDQNKLGILAAVRNLRNILKGDRDSLIGKVAALVSNGDLIRKGKVMPHQLEFATEAVRLSEVSQHSKSKVLKALESGMMSALPNLAEILTGRTLVAVDCSGSMSIPVGVNGQKERYGRNRRHSSCIDKAAIVAAMLAKSVNADVITFGNHAQWYNYNPNDSLATISGGIKANLGGTDIGSVFRLINDEKRKYDRIFILSDNEANHGCVRTDYKNYVRNVCSPYIYCVDLACYGSVPLKNADKVRYYNGYGYAMFDDVASAEFNPTHHIDKVRKIQIPGA